MYEIFGHTTGSFGSFNGLLLNQPLDNKLKR